MSISSATDNDGIDKEPSGILIDKRLDKVIDWNNKENIIKTHNNWIWTYVLVMLNWTNNGIEKKKRKSRKR